VAAREQARAFVADVLAGGAGLEQRHSLVMVGPALYAEIKAHDASFEHLGTAVELMNPNGQGSAAARVCSAEDCASFLRAKGLRDFLRQFGGAEFRSATGAERKIMIERSPDNFPEDAPATVAVADENVLGIYAVTEHMTWIELLSKTFQVTFPDLEPPTAEARRIDAARCLKLDSVQLEQPEEAFAKNTSPKDLARGVAQLVDLVDGLLLDVNSQATGTWTIRFAFDDSGVSKVAAAARSGIDRAVFGRIEAGAAGHSPFSRGPELSFQLQLTLRPCSN